MSEPIKIAVILEGGNCSAVLTAGVPVEYVVVDYDVECVTDTERLRDVPQPDGTTERAFVSPLCDAEPEGPLVLKLLELAAEPSAETDPQPVESGRYEYQATLDRYDRGDLDDAGAIAELQRAGWTERRAYSILEQHQNS